MRAPLLFLPVILAGFLASAAPPPPAGSASVVKAILAEAREGNEHPSARQVQLALKPVDIDGDGRPDYLFSKQALGAGWCGTGGCWTEIWLDRAPGRPLKIFDGQVREVGFRRAGAGRIVDVDLHGSVCHTFGAHACPASFRWDGRLGRLVETATPNGKGIVRFLKPTETADRSPPAAVTAAFRAAVAACAKSGGTASDPEGPLTVPDVDGDGMRDWVVPEFYCDLPEGTSAKPPPMSLFASAGNASAPVLAATAARLEIDAATRPAAVSAVDLETCSPDAMEPQKCRRHRLIWSQEGRRLLPQGNSRGGVR
jgi:hypothetical protein